MLVTIKKHFNISLIAIAKFTDTPLPTLRSVSIQRRSFSNVLTSKLLVLYNALLLNTPITNLLFITPFLNKEKENKVLVMQDLLVKKEKKLKICEKKLEENKQKRENWLYGLNACYVLLNNTTLTTENFKWIVLRKNHLKQHLAGASLSNEALLVANIAGLKSEIKVIKKMLL